MQHSRGSSESGARVRSGSGQVRLERWGGGEVVAATRRTKYECEDLKASGVQCGGHESERGERRNRVIQLCIVHVIY